MMEEQYAEEQYEQGPYPLDGQINADTGCWGAALISTTDGCTRGFIPGKGHLKNKFCPDCVQHGIFVDARRVRAITESMHGEFANARGAGLWTTIRTQDQVDHRYRLVNQTHLCKGPRLVVFEAEPPHSVAWAPWATAEFVVDGFVHLRLGLGTLVPTKTAVANPTPAALPAPVQMLPAPPPTFDALLAAHDHLGHLASASMLQPDLSDQQRIALAELLPKLNSSAASLRRASLAALAPSGLVAGPAQGMMAPPPTATASSPDDAIAAAAAAHAAAAAAHAAATAAGQGAAMAAAGFEPAPNALCVGGPNGTSNNIMPFGMPFGAMPPNVAPMMGAAPAPAANPVVMPMICAAPAPAAQSAPPPMGGGDVQMGGGDGGGLPQHPASFAPPPPGPDPAYFSFPPSAPGTEYQGSPGMTPASGTPMGSLRGSLRILAPQVRGRLTTTTPLGSDKGSEQGSGRLPASMLAAAPAAEGKPSAKPRRKSTSIAAMLYVYTLILVICTGIVHSLNEKVVLPFAVAHTQSKWVLLVAWVGSLAIWILFFVAFVFAGRRSGVLVARRASDTMVGVAPVPGVKFSLRHVGGMPRQPRRRLAVFSVLAAALCVGILATSGVVVASAIRAVEDEE